MTAFKVPRTFTTRTTKIDILFKVLDYLSVLALRFVVETFSFITRDTAAVELSSLVTALRRGASRKSRQWETHSSSRPIPIDYIIK
jgi:hypothetical protein